MKCFLFLQCIFFYMCCVNSNNIEGLEFEDNGATTHITEENGIASINFWVGILCLQYPTVLNNEAIN